MYRLGLQSLSKNFASTFGRQIVVALLAIGTASIIARHYGPEGSGILAVSLLLPTMLSVFFNFGVASANIYFVGSGKIGICDVITINIKIWLRLVIIGFFFGGLIIFFKKELFFPGISAGLLWLTLPLFAITLLNSYLTSIFQGLQKFSIYNLFFIVQPLLNFSIIVLLLFWGNDHLEMLIIAQLIATMGALLLALFYTKKLYFTSLKDTKKTTQKLSDEYVKKTLSYGWKAHAGSIVSFINYRADVFMINFFLTPFYSGIYIVAVTLAEALWLMSTAVSTVLLPRLAELSKNEGVRKELTPLVSRVVLLATLLGGLVLALCADFIVNIIFGIQYKNSVQPLLLLLPGIILLSVARIWANDIAARGKPEINMYISFITLVVNIVGNVFLIPIWGVSGAAIATTLAYATGTLVTLIVYTHLASNNWKSMLFVTAIDIKFFKKTIGILRKK